VIGLEAVAKIELVPELPFEPKPGAPPVPPPPIVTGTAEAGIG
jgi:hypothetical protein